MVEEHVRWIGRWRVGWTGAWMVLDVETERFGRTYAGREGRVIRVSRDPETMVFNEYLVDLGDDPAGVPFKPDEVRFLD